MNRLLIYHHFNRHHGLSSYVIDALARLSPVFREVIFVSNSHLSEEMTGQLSPYCQRILQRENKGFDFGGWRDAMKATGWDVLQKFESITLMNDSCFGPLFEMDEIFDQMERPEIDFWGVSFHPERKRGMPGTGGSVSAHIQSYFISFSNKVIASKAFQQFWQDVEDYPDVNLVIQKYETKLTSLLAKAGFSYEAYINFRLKDEDINERAIFTDPDVMLQFGSPLIKIKAFLYFETPPCLLKMISMHSSYDISLIEAYFTNVYNPNVSINIVNKNVFLPKSERKKVRANMTVALHFHVFYVDVFEKHIMQLFNNTITPVHLFITTDSNEKKLQILAFATKYGIEDHIKEIILVENRGRDVLPWLSVAPMMKNYDVAGHFHTKKSLINKEWVGDTWMTEIINVLIHPLDEVLSLFSDHHDVGIVIPDIPVFYKNMLGIDLWDKSRATFVRLWDKMNLKKHIDPMQILSPIMPYGNMFWYRPEALKPLFDLKLTADDFPPEPLPNDGTIAHAFESLPVYVAWAQGYDFRVLLNPEFPHSGFNNKVLIRRIEENKQLLASPSWRVGRIVSYIPGKIFRFVQSVTSRLSE